MWTEVWTSDEMGRTARHAYRNRLSTVFVDLLDSLCRYDHIINAAPNERLPRLVTVRIRVRLTWNEGRKKKKLKTVFSSFEVIAHRRFTPFRFHYTNN